MKKIALVHEWFTPKATGGSELVVKEILEHLKEEVDLFSLIDFESTNPASYLYGKKIHTTFLQRFPRAKSGVQKYLPLLPLAIEQLDVRSYDIILSSNHAVAKGILTSPHQTHVCYCHTPMRYVWDLTFDYLASSRLGMGTIGWVTRYILHQLRLWDVISANRVDYFIANSQHTANRIWRCYRRESVVIYPPVKIDKFKYQPDKEDFYLTVCRLVSYKRVDLMVKAFNQLGKSLVVIGTGPELSKLQKIAKSNVELLGWQPDDIVVDYMSRAKAFIYGALEDFGIALVESQAGGTPVIAYGQGGALETVIDIRVDPKNGSGLFFKEQTIESLMETILLFEERQKDFNYEVIRENSLRFSESVFGDRYIKYLEQVLQFRLK